ncbi:subclass B1 metallo-beta-lactamase [Flavobacterium dankookense]|uniref:beta-lactamase n=1 Tax=Flavobacterium dankookense TaxID=706186 RepID=A0A4R6Q6B1_9FLAO|nr:subclass B1 metallo-beta-lactamase [Flavobacterium dankookense]TDP57978.1 metallo-beta-lactamase class B [Flavobacterium dankookense]
MKTLSRLLLLTIIPLLNLGCGSKKSEAFQSKEVYKSNDLIITQVSKNAFVHTSFLQTQDFGNVPCNGLIVSNNKETIIFDTPTSNTTSEELIKWISETQQAKINAIIPTHFHNDCLAGLTAFHNKNIPSYSYFKTIEFAKNNNETLPQNSFNDSLVLNVGNEQIIAKFFGEGHTKDNIVGYFPSENVLFGGCLIKELKATKGYLGDANTAEWSKTVEKIKKEYPNLKIVVPGHGDYGSTKLLDYTIKLFANK